MGTLVGIRVLDHQTESYRRHDHIVFVGDDAASDWTRRCRRQADEILLVGGAGNSPKSSPPDERSTHPTTYFDDLWIDFLCTTTDLTSAAQRIHTRGRLRQFVRRSCSLPMVMPPVSLDGHLLVDGGIMNNVPVDPLPEVSNEGTLIVADVADCFYTADEAYDDDSIAFRRVPSSRLNQFGEKLVASGIFDVLMRSLEIGSKILELSQIAKDGVCLRPEVSRYGYTDISFLDDIAEAGYREAVERLAKCELPIIPFEDGSASR